MTKTSDLQSSPLPKPVAGPLFRQAAKIDAGGDKRRKLLCLLAAYADAGIDDPSIAQLAKRAQIPRGIVVVVVEKLEAAGLLAVYRGDPTRQERNRYTLYLDGRKRP
jgi:DNA-binding MarR family transcriptional regulator